MKNFIAGAILGGALMVAGTVAYAATAGVSGLSVVDRLGSNVVVKIYDKDADVICYEIYGSGISCLKNN